MTVKELIEELKKHPEDYEVEITTAIYSNYGYTPQSFIIQEQFGILLISSDLGKK